MKKNENIYNFHIFQLCVVDWFKLFELNRKFYKFQGLYTLKSLIFYSNLKYEDFYLKTFYESGLLSELGFDTKCTTKRPLYLLRVSKKRLTARVKRWRVDCLS